MRPFAYDRVSGKEQIEGYSLAAQERAMREYCAAHGWPEPVIWTDAGRSGYTDVTEDRPQFAAMLAAAEAGECDVILVHKLDRFARSLMTTLRELRRLERAGVGFVSLSENMDFSSPIGRVILSVLAAFAEYYSANLSRETKKGLDERRRQGYLPSIIPYGARLDATGKALVVDPQTDAALALLLELVATESYIGAARALNERGIPARRGGTWHGSSVRVVVERAGWLASQPSPWPERYTAAVTRLGKASVRAGRATRMLTGLLRCAHCGRTIGYQPRGAFPPSLKCQRTDGTPPCTGPGKHLAPHYEAQVAAWVAALPDEDALAALAARQAEAGDPSLALAEALRAEGERLNRAYVKGRMDEATYDALAAEIAARKRALPAPTLNVRRRIAELAQIRDGFTALPAVAQNAALRGLCARVTIDGARAIVVPHPDMAALLR